jgi:hypothetical protein
VGHLEVAYVPGVMPGKWVSRFQETHQQDTLDARPLSEGDDPLTELAAGRTRLVLLRFPEGSSPAGPRLHVIPLYTERPMVVAPKDHDVEYHDEDAVIPAEEAAEWPRLDPHDYPPSVGGVAMMLEVLAAGDRAVAVLPQSLARLHARKDLVTRFVDGETPTVVGLAWPRIDSSLPEEDQPLAVAAQDDPLVEEFIGVVRGRRAGSSRQPSVRAREQEQRRERLAGGKPAKGAKDAKGSRGTRGGAGSSGTAKRTQGKQGKEGTHGEGSRRAPGPRRGAAGTRNRRRGGPRR